MTKDNKACLSKVIPLATPCAPGKFVAKILNDKDKDLHETCEDCMKDCISCNSEDFCLKCDTKLELTPDFSKCISLSTCNDNEFNKYNSGTKAFDCVTCPEFCAKCDYVILTGEDRALMLDIYINCSECEVNYEKDKEKVTFNGHTIERCVIKNSVDNCVAGQYHFLPAKSCLPCS
jgi:hypothetical protein